MNWLAFIALAILLLGTAVYDWREGLYGACGLHIVLGAALLSISGLLAVGAHL